MNKSVLVLGIVFFAIGLIMWIVGDYYYNISYKNYLTGGLLDILGGTYPRDYESYMSFWRTFSGIGFLLFISGIPITIVGAVIGEESSFFQSHQQIIIKRKLCEYCGNVIPYESNACQYCGKNLVEKSKNITENLKSDNVSQMIQSQSSIKEFFCPNCGTKLESSPVFCFNCGFKLR